MLGGPPSLPHSMIVSGPRWPPARPPTNFAESLFPPECPPDSILFLHIPAAYADRQDGSNRYPFRLDPFLTFLGRAPTLWATFSEISSCFALIRSDTASSKARRYRDGALRCLPAIFFTCQA